MTGLLPGQQPVSQPVNFQTPKARPTQWDNLSKALDSFSTLNVPNLKKSNDATNVFGRAFNHSFINDPQKLDSFLQFVRKNESERESGLNSFLRKNVSGSIFSEDHYGIDKATTSDQKIKVAQKILDDFKNESSPYQILDPFNPIGAGAIGFGNAATAGLYNLTAKNKTYNPATIAQEIHPTAYEVGAFAGQALPIGAIESGASAGIKAIAPTLEKTAPILDAMIRGGFSMGAYSAIQDVASGKDAKQAAIDLAENVGIGALGGAVFGSLKKPEAIDSIANELKTAATEIDITSGKKTVGLDAPNVTLRDDTSPSNIVELNDKCGNTNNTASQSIAEPQADQASTVDHAAADDGAAQNKALSAQAGSFEKELLGEEPPTEAVTKAAISRSANATAAPKTTAPSQSLKNSKAALTGSVPQGTPEDLAWTSTPDKTALAADAGNGQAYTITKQDGQYSARRVDPSSGKVVKDIGTFDTQALAQKAAKGDLDAAGEERFGEALGIDGADDGTVGQGKIAIDGLDFQKGEGETGGEGEGNIGSKETRNSEFEKTLSKKKEVDVRKFPTKLLKSKPKHSPTPKDWIENGGHITIDDDGVWIYHDREGNSVSYPDGYPNFDEAGLVKENVNIQNFKNYHSDFRKANNLAQTGPITDKETWHHSQDMHTLQKMNKILHNRFTHKGGMSKMSELE